MNKIPWDRRKQKIVIIDLKEESSVNQMKNTYTLLCETESSRSVSKINWIELLPCHELRRLLLVRLSGIYFCIDSNPSEEQQQATSITPFFRFYLLRHKTLCIWREKEKKYINK